MVSSPVGDVVIQGHTGNKTDEELDAIEERLLDLLESETEVHYRYSGKDYADEPVGNQAMRGVIVGIDRGRDGFTVEVTRRGPYDNNTLDTSTFNGGDYISVP